MRNAFVLIAGTLAALAVVVVPVGAQSSQYYVLDGFGGVHAGGGAPSISPATPYFGFDVAQDIAYLPYGGGRSHGDGVLVLDRFGGVHAGGAILSGSVNPRPPYFGFDIARAIAYRNIPTRATGAVVPDATLITTNSNTYTSLLPSLINAPDDGFLLVNMSMGVSCQSASGTALVQVTLDVDSTVGDPDIRLTEDFADCADVGEATTAVAPMALTRLFPVSAGPHTVHLLLRKLDGTQGVYAFSKSLTVLFVDQDGGGGS